MADFYSLPVEKIEIAKYFPEKFEWLPISSWVSWAFSEKAELVDLTIEQVFHSGRDPMKTWSEFY